MPSSVTAALFQALMLVALTDCAPEIFETCTLQLGEFNRSPSVAIASVNGTFQQQPHSVRRDQLVCTLFHHTRTTSQEYVVFDLLLEGDTPQKIDLEMADIFFHDLRSRLIVCVYSEIGKESKVNASVPVKTSQNVKTGRYICDNSLAKIIFTGMPTGFAGVEESDHKREKHSIFQKTTTKCYNRTFESSHGSSGLGEPCGIENGIGHRYMFNEDGDLDCLTCCPGHHYDEISKGCNKCLPGKTRLKMNVWPQCIQVNENINSQTILPTNASTSTGQKSKHRTSMSTPTTEFRMKPPKNAPSGLIMMKVGGDHAFIVWNATNSHLNMPVDHYFVEYRKFPSNTSLKHKVESKMTWDKLTGLHPGSCYEVTVAACNDAGCGPQSDTLDLDTQRVLSKLENLRKSNDTEFIKFAWNNNPEDHDLSIKAEIWVSGGHPKTGWTFSKHHSSGQIEIPFNPSLTGNYSVRLFYSNNCQDGPKSEVTTIQYKVKDTKAKIPVDSGVNIWIILFIALVVLDVLAALLLFRRNISDKFQDLRNRIAPAWDYIAGSRQ